MYVVMPNGTRSRSRYASLAIRKHATTQVSHARASAARENINARCPNCFHGPSADPDEIKLRTALGLGPVSSSRAAGAKSANESSAFVLEEMNGLLDTRYSRKALSNTGHELFDYPEDTL
jgi:hypothetical protein